MELQSQDVREAIHEKSMTVNIDSTESSTWGLCGTKTNLITFFIE